MACDDPLWPLRFPLGTLRWLSALSCARLEVNKNIEVRTRNVKPSRSLECHDLVCTNVRIVFSALYGQTSNSKHKGVKAPVAW